MTSSQNDLHNKKRIRNLMKAVNSSDSQVRLKKAVRHFNDAINLRTPRNDIESL